MTAAPEWGRHQELAMRLVVLPCDLAAAGVDVAPVGGSKEGAGTYTESVVTPPTRPRPMLIAYVSDERYVALPDVLIELEGDAGSFEARSRATGAVHADVPPGNYRVTLQKPGFGAKSVRPADHTRARTLPTAAARRRIARLCLAEMAEIRREIRVPRAFG